MIQRAERRVQEALREALVSGTADPPNHDRPWPAPLRWTRKIGIGRLRYSAVTTAVDFVLAWMVLATTVSSLAVRTAGVWPIGLGLAVALPVAFRSRNPLIAWRAEAGVLAATTLYAGHVMPDPYLHPGVVAFLLCLYSVAVRCSRQLTVTVGLVSLAGSILLLPFTQRTNNSIGEMAAVLIGAVLILGYNVRQRRLAQQEVVTQAKAHAEVQAVLEERQRIARELHDVVAHHMSVIAIQAEAAPYKVAEPQPELAESLADIRKLALEGLTELRRVLGVLRTETGGAETAPQPGLDRLGELIASAEAGGLTVESSVVGTARVVPRALTLSAYRIAQEALSNVMKYAPGAHVRITTEYGPDRLRLVVANSPVTAGGDAALNGAGSGHGLVGMRERAGMLGGEISSGPTPEGGFVVTATLPLDAAS